MYALSYSQLLPSGVRCISFAKHTKHITWTPPLQRGDFPLPGSIDPPSHHP